MTPRHSDISRSTSSTAQSSRAAGAAQRPVSNRQATTPPTPARSRARKRPPRADVATDVATDVASGSTSAAARDASPDMAHELRALSAGALHMTVYDLLAHAYNRVAIQFYHDQGSGLLMDIRRYPPTLFAPVLPAALQRDVVNALLADAARALSTFFGFAEMNFILLDHEQNVYRLGMREGPFFPHFQPGVYTQPFGTGLLGQCHLERRTVLVNDVSAVDIYVSNDPAVRAELCVPVVLDGEVLAIIDSGAYTVNAFTRAHASFMEDFARYLAPAIADPLAFLQAWRPELVHGTSGLAPLAQSLNFLYVWHEEWRARFANLYTEVAQRNAELMALNDLSTALRTSLRLDTILATIVAKVAELLACQVSWILLPDDDGILRIRAQHGGTMTKAAEAGVIAPDSPQLLVFTSGEARISNDLTAAPRSGFDWTFCKQNQIVRYATVPLRARERPIGVMNVGRTHPSEALTEHDVQLLSTFATQIALAIENAALYEHSRLLGAAEERARLARDLHDTLTQSMLTILRTLESLETGAHDLPEPLLKRVSEARELARQSLDEARRSVWNLQAAALDHASLREAMERYVATWSAQTGIRARFERKGHPVPLAAHVESELLLITREGLQNVARHAQATAASVVLQFAPAGLRLLMNDDGIGFDAADRFERQSPNDGSSTAATHLPQSISATDGHSDPNVGMGLRGMRERAHLLGGSLQIESAEGWGTRLILTLPRSAFDQTAHAPLPRSVLSGADIIVGDVRAATHLHLERGSHPGGLIELAPTDAKPEANATDGDGATGDLTQPSHPVISVVLADDHPALREGLRQALAATANIQVVGEASSAREAITLVRLHQPDVLLLDIRLPDEDGLSALRQIQAGEFSTQVVMLTAHNDDAYVVAALQAGAAGYLNKDVPTPDLIAAIRSAAAGRRVFSPAVASRLRGREGLLVNPRAGHLTPREREILTMLAAGMRYRAIAARLCVAEATIKFHVLNLYQKLQSSSRVEALNQARRWGLLD